MSVISRRHFIGSAAAASAIPLLGSSAHAQADWPTRPIRIVAGYPAGGQTDLFARTYGEYIRTTTGQNVVVENKAGASGSVAAVEAKRAAPDGYTLMFTISTTMIMNRVLIKDIPYDADKDFTLVSIMPAGSLPFVAGEKTGAKTLAEFVAYAKKAEKVNVGTYGAGSYAHMAIVEMNRQYGLNIEAGPLSRRSADVDRSCRWIYRWRPRQLLRRIVRAAERPRPCGRRLSQAHVDIARRSLLCGAGHNLTHFQADRLPMLRRAQGHATGNHSEAVKTSGRGRQD